MFNIKNILYPINLDSSDISPVVKALEIAQSFNSTVHILYNNNPQAGYRCPADHKDDVALKVKEVAHVELLSRLNIVYAVTKGDLGEEIRNYCRKEKIDLVITGHKHHNKLYSLFFDTPDENIIDSVKLPVLVIPKK